jgi:phage terminase small subunit
MSDSSLARRSLPRPRRRLNERERAFCHAYVFTSPDSAAEAARLAGYEGDASTLASTAYRLLGRPRVLRLVERLAARKVATSNQILAELSSIATAPYRDFVEVKLDSDGNTIGAQLRLADKVKAAEIVLKALGRFRDPFLVKLQAMAEREIERAAALRRAAKAEARGGEIIDVAAEALPQARPEASDAGGEGPARPSSTPPDASPASVHRGGEGAPNQEEGRARAPYPPGARTRKATPPS